MKEKIQNILVVEDDQNVLEAIMGILEYSGYQPTGVTRFNENVLKQLKTDGISLIILDVMLSGDDGRDLAVMLKSSEETRGVPILMTSAYPEIEPSVMKAGADGFIPKPFGIDELMQKVEEYV